MQFKKFITSKGPILALIIGLIYGVVIFAIYYTGYQAMPNNLDQLPVTVVNQDAGSKKLSRQLKKALPFETVKTSTDLKQAKAQLNQRKTYLIVAIPKNFAKDVKANRTVNLNFYINESNQTSVVSGMKAVAQSIGTTVNQQVVLQKGTLMLGQTALTQLQTSVAQEKATMQAQVTKQKQTIAQAPAAQQAQLSTALNTQVATQTQQAKTKAAAQKQAILKQTKKTAEPLAHSVQTKIHRQNKVATGLNHSLAPFIANLAIYIGALIGTLLLYGTFVKFAKTIGRFKAFVNLQFSMAIVAIVSAALVSWAMVAMMGISAESFMALWGTHSLMIFAAYNFNAILMLVMGQMGTVFNIFWTMLQVVAGAGMIPVAAMNGFFKGIHAWMPMYYGVAADFNTMYGGIGNQSLWLNLAGLTLVYLVINLMIVTIRKTQTMVQFEKLS